MTDEIEPTITDVDTKLKEHTTILDELKEMCVNLQSSIDRLEKVTEEVKSMTNSMPKQFTRGGQYRIR